MSIFITSQIAKQTFMLNFQNVQVCINPTLVKQVWIFFNCEQIFSRCFAKESGRLLRCLWKRQDWDKVVVALLTKTIRPQWCSGNTKHPTGPFRRGNAALHFHPIKCNWSQLCCHFRTWLPLFDLSISVWHPLPLIFTNSWRNLIVRFFFLPSHTLP